MCVIAIKKQGYKLNEEYVRNCFSNNDDGAGFMFALGKKVFIEKGFFKVEDMLARLEELDNLVDLESKNLVMHFRIATSGNVDGATTHPFPISKKLKDLQKENVVCKSGIVHNGIISKYRNEVKMSDTQRFILNDVSRLFLKNNQKRLKKEFNGNGKFCILKADGSFQTYGDFIEVENEGYIFSNSSYSYNYYDYLKYSKSYGYGYDYAYSTGVTYSDFDKYFNDFLAEEKSMKKEDFYARLENLYILEGYVSLTNKMYVNARRNYAVDVEGTLYKINYKEFKITDTFEEVEEVYEY